MNGLSKDAPKPIGLFASKPRSIFLGLELSQLPHIDPEAKEHAQELPQGGIGYAAGNRDQNIGPMPLDAPYCFDAFEHREKGILIDLGVESSLAANKDWHRELSQIVGW